MLELHGCLNVLIKLVGTCWWPPDCNILNNKNCAFIKFFLTTESVCSKTFFFMLSSLFAPSHSYSVSVYVYVYVCIYIHTQGEIVCGGCGQRGVCVYAYIHVLFQRERGGTRSWRMEKKAKFRWVVSLHNKSRIVQENLMIYIFSHQLLSVARVIWVGIPTWYF